MDAADKEEAWKRDSEHGALLEKRYTNAEGNWMAWTFERTGEVKVLSEDQIAARVEVLSLTEILTTDYKKSA